MTDRELLELAIKAAGLDIGWTDDKWGQPDAVPYIHLNTGQLWNPLADDGDALRLAVKLHIDFKCYNTTVRTWVGDPVAQRVIASIEEMCGEDPYAATRRAIVRAAAEIGKQMEGERRE